MLVIPAIDLKDGQCVRLRQGKMNESTVFSESPVDMAGHWAEQGAKRLHVVDLNGAITGNLVNSEIIASIVKSFPDLQVQIGGGIRSLESIKFYLDVGARFVIIGTAALKDPDFVAEACQMYPGKVIVGLDTVNGKVATEGWAEVSKTSPIEIVNKFSEFGVQSIVYTDIARDGMMQGCNIEATVELARQSSIPIIASGGIAKFADIVDLKAATKKEVGVNIVGAITGRAIYEGKLDLMAAQKYCNSEAS